jgi:UDP-N-acetylmuramate--alanine ligase
MTDFKNIEGIYFLGIGGIGMSALARYFRAGKFSVAGYDRTESPLTAELKEEGCDITYTDALSSLPAPFNNLSFKDRVLIIYTPAIPADSLLLNYFRDNGYTIKKRSQVLGMISNESDTVAIAGTHGKTTVSTMTAHLLTSSHVGCSAFLGGISRNYNTNLLIGTSRLAVMEADEFDRSFHQLNPLTAVVTAMDPDHLDIYGTAESMIEAYNIFCGKVRRGGSLIVNEKIASMVSKPEGVSFYTYGFDESSSFRATNIVRGEGYYNFDIKTPFGEINNIRLLMPGMVNILNATAAASAALISGAEPDEIARALFLYKGVNRRFDVRLSLPQVVYIDDYAHHPEEINSLISAVRDFYPGRKVTGIFQPHLYSRTRDFAEGFASALDRLDEIVLLTLYPAREKPLPGVSSDMIAALMKNKNVRVLSREELLLAIPAFGEGIVLTIGAGDIDRLVDPITELLKLKYR